MKRWLLLLVTLVAGLWVRTAEAHPLAPVVLKLAPGDGLVEATMKEPAVRPRGDVYAPIWPNGCEPVSEPKRVVQEDARLTRYQLRCEGSLVGASVGVSGLGDVTAVVRVDRGESRVHQALVDARHPTTTIVAASPLRTVVADYVRMGMRHLFAGLDHLLFILGLMLLVRGRRRVVIALTAFTLGHSVTLGAAVLGLVRLPTGAVELGIALSLVLLALQIAKAPDETSDDETSDDETSDDEEREPRRPWLFALSFGLLHGFGFAGGIMEAGVPAADIPAALFGFNLGVELGQLAVVIAAWLLLALARRAAPKRLADDGRSLTWLRLAPSYLIGSLAAMWCFERAVQWLA